VNYKDASGHWRKINNRLVPDDRGGFVNAGNVFRAQLPEALGSAPVRFSSGSRWVSFSLDHASGLGVVSGSTETFANALPGVDVVYNVANTQLNEDLVLLGPLSPTSFTYSLSMSAGLRPVSGSDGSIRFVDSRGKARLWFLPPTMTDAWGATGAVSFALASTARGYRLTVKPDATWLSSPFRAWPVTIDPSSSGDFDWNSIYSNNEGYMASGTNANRRRHAPLPRGG